jgi:hypothetical protein
MKLADTKIDYFGGRSRCQSYFFSLPPESSDFSYLSNQRLKNKNINFYTKIEFEKILRDRIGILCKV